MPDDGAPPATVSEGWVELLAREPWHWFCTLTFSPDKGKPNAAGRRVVIDKWTGKEVQANRFHPLRGMHLEAADKAFRYFIRCINEQLYGDQRETRMRDRKSIIWARGQEFHKSGRVHFHSLFAAPDCDLNKATSRYRWHEWWYREFGRNQIERPRDQDDVLGYVSKYVTKDGEVDLSPNFGRVRPPELFSVEQCQRAGRHGVWPATSESATRASGVGQEARIRPGLSLTLPVRPQETQSQVMFSDETFFQPPRRECDASDD